MPPSSTIDQRAQEVVEEFSLFADWMDKYAYLIDLGKSLPLIDEQYKDEDHLVRGCQSQVWLHAEPQDGRVRYYADSDALITKGLIALLVRVLDDQPADAIAQADLGFIDQIGMREHLSPNRSNGLDAMVKKMKLYALTHTS